MKQYTFSDMNRSSGEILEAAMIEPVVVIAPIQLPM